MPQRMVSGWMRARVVVGNGLECSRFVKSKGKDDVGSIGEAGSEV